MDLWFPYSEILVDRITETNELPRELRDKKEEEKQLLFRNSIEIECLRRIEKKFQSLWK
jgi:hypothetical protein